MANNPDQKGELLEQLHKLDESMLWCSWLEVTARNYVGNLELASQWNDVMVRLEMQYDAVGEQLTALELTR